MDQKTGSKYILIGIILIAVVLAFLIVRPFITVLLTSAVIAYIFYPLYKGLNSKLKMKNLSAGIMTIFIILIIAVPSGFLFYQIGKEASIGYIRVQQHVSTGFESCAGNSVCDFLRSPQVKYQIQANTEKVTKYIEEGAKDFIFSIPKRIIELLIMLLSIFFFLRDGPEILSGLRNIAPLKDHHEEKIASQLKEVTRAIVYGIFVVAVFEAIIAALVFWLAGISSPILWAVVIAILAFIPLIGPAVIWVPAAAISLISHHPASAIILIIGGLVISSIDFFVKPRVIGKRAKVHSLIIFVGLLGGIAFFGISGIVLGPLILALLITFLKIYKEERLA